MRPTASSASKTHDKPASPPRKGASVLQKGKKKVEEVAAKAKEAVTTNGQSAESGTVTEDEAAKASDAAHTEAGAEAPEELHQEADSSVAELQTPHLAGETVR
jgi:hypothetical protein